MTRTRTLSRILPGNREEDKKVHAMFKYRRTGLDGMKKAVLLGVAQGPKHSVFQLEKKKQALDAIRELLHNLEFATWDTAKLMGPLGAADTGKPTMKYSNSAYDDKYFAMSKGQYTVQVFFGKKKVILSVQTINDEREHLLSVVQKFCGK